MLEQLVALIIDTLKNPQTWGGVLIGGMSMYYAIATGKVITKRESDLKSELATEKAAREALAKRVEELEEKLEPLQKWLEKQASDKFADTGTHKVIRND